MCTHKFLNSRKKYLFSFLLGSTPLPHYSICTVPFKSYCWILNLLFEISNSRFMATSTVKNEIVSQIAWIFNYYVQLLTNTKTDIWSSASHEEHDFFLWSFTIKMHSTKVYCTWYVRRMTRPKYRSAVIYKIFEILLVLFSKNRFVWWPWWWTYPPPSQSSQGYKTLQSIGYWYHQDTVSIPCRSLL